MLRVYWSRVGHGPDEPFKVYIYIQGASAQGQDSATFAE